MMTQLELTTSQRAILLETLKATLSDLSVEIAGTDKKSYRDEIKAERKLLRQIVAKLEEPATA